MTDFSQPIKPDNTPRRRARRDPDEETTPPPPAADTPPPPPATAPAPPQPSPQTRERSATIATRPSGLLASLQASRPEQGSAGDRTDDDPEGSGGPDVNLIGLMGLRHRPIDPHEDWGPDGTRIPRFILDAIGFIARTTGRSLQEVKRDALLGVRPIPAEVIHSAYEARYGHPYPVGWTPR